MSNHQIKICLADILGYSEPELTTLWQDEKIKKLASTTSTLYNISINKVKLKQTEELARCHICAYIACERMAEKYDPKLRYYSDKIPVAPNTVRRLVNIFKRIIWNQSSPAAELVFSNASSFTPSKSRSNLKNLHFTGIDPEDLRRHLFDTPSKQVTNSSNSKLSNSVSTDKIEKHKKSNGTTARRKLLFEDEESDVLHFDGTEDGPDLSESEIPIQTLHTPKKGANLINLRNVFGEVEDDPMSPIKQSPMKSPSKGTSSPRKERGKYGQWNMLYKKYHRLTPQETISLCNQFELPSEVAYKILDEFNAHVSFLVYPVQLICGMVMLCCFAIYNKQRAQDPQLDSKLIQKMCTLMRSQDPNDIEQSITITKELIEGEKWYRDLRIRFNFYDGSNYLNAIAVRLGDMLQEGHTVVDTVEYNAWKRKISIDLSIRDGK